MERLYRLVGERDVERRELAGLLVGSLAGRGYEEVEDRVTDDALLDRLPERERLIVKLRFREELLQREIAALLGISQMQVSRLLTRAIAELQRSAGELPS